LDLKNGVESGTAVVKSHEAAFHDLAKEIKKLRQKVSEQEKRVFKLCMKGMYAFCACM
jgi:hypothetical protein